MSEQIVTGDSLEGQIGNLHKEDVVLDFTGTRPDQLIVDCYYRGTVDGYADFGIFVNLGDHVTGLLHRSEIPRRLESLNWDQGDDVFVQVTNVRDNGNVDLGWSLRDSLREFRGQYVHDPDDTLDDSDVAIAADDTDDAESQTTETEQPEPTDTEQQPSTETAADSTPDQSQQPSIEADHPQSTASESKAVTETTPDAGQPSADLQRASIGGLSEQIGDVVRLEGVVTDVRQTSGPTVFSIQDETATVDCAAFDGAGVRAYPSIESGDYVRLTGEVRERRGELQIETEALEALSDDGASSVASRMDDAIQAEAAVDNVDPLADDTAVEAVLDGIRTAATKIRRAVIESRPIVVRHETTVDGYLAGAAIEHAVEPRIEDEHVGGDAIYHLFDRRPLEGAYDMDDATNDVTSLLSSQNRHSQQPPLFVFVATGSTTDSLDGLELLELYDVDVIVIDDSAGEATVGDAIEVLINPQLAGESSETSTTALASTVAVHVTPDIRSDLGHLPAASFWETPPAVYAELAERSPFGYEQSQIDQLRESIALQAYYQSYDGKRELIGDLLFDQSVSDGLIEQVSEQFREKLDTELETAEANLDRTAENGVAFAVLDTDAFTHRFDFPSTELLLDEIHRRNRDGTFVTIGVDEDEIAIRSTTPVDLQAVVEYLDETVPNAGVTARDGNNRIGFVVGERTAIEAHVFDAITATLQAPQAN